MNNLFRKKEIKDKFVQLDFREVERLSIAPPTDYTTILIYSLSTASSVYIFISYTHTLPLQVFIYITILILLNNYAK